MRFPRPREGAGEAVHSPWGEGTVCLGEKELDLHEMLLVLRRRLKLVIILPMVAAIATGIASYYLLTPVYEASATLWVSDEDPTQLTYNDPNLAATYVEVARSRSVMETVIRRLNLVGVTPEDLQKKLSVSALNGTKLLSIAVKDPDPRIAANLANAVASAFRDEIPRFMKAPNVVVLDEAVAPVEPEEPRPLLDTAIAFVFGATAAVGLAFLQEYMDTSVKTPEDLTRYGKVPVLAVIPSFDGSAAKKGLFRRRSRTAQRKEEVGA